MTSIPALESQLESVQKLSKTGTQGLGQHRNWVDDFFMMHKSTYEKHRECTRRMLPEKAESVNQEVSNFRVLGKTRKSGSTRTYL